MRPIHTLLLAPALLALAACGPSTEPTTDADATVPPVAPAICNAIYAACGHRVRSLPLVKEGFSV